MKGETARAGGEMGLREGEGPVMKVQFFDGSAESAVGKCSEINWATVPDLMARRRAEVPPIRRYFSYVMPFAVRGE